MTTYLCLSEESLKRLHRPQTPHVKFHLYFIWRSPQASILQVGGQAVAQEVSMC